MNDKVQILALHLKGFLDCAKLQGMHEKDILRLLTHCPADLNNPASTLNESDFYKVLEKISDNVKDDFLA